MPLYIDKISLKNDNLTIATHQELPDGNTKKRTVTEPLEEKNDQEVATFQTSLKDLLPYAISLCELTLNEEEKDYLKITGIRFNYKKDRFGASMQVKKHLVNSDKDLVFWTPFKTTASATNPDDRIDPLREMDNAYMKYLQIVLKTVKPLTFSTKEETVNFQEEN